MEKRTQELLNKLETETRIIKAEVVRDKLITQLTDGREVIITIDLLTKYGILNKDIKPEQLKNSEIQNDGRYIYFPIIDDILPVRIISKGLFNACWGGNE